MRTLGRTTAFNTVCYSYTDRQVEGIVKYSFVVGALAGGMIALALTKIFQ